MKRILHILNDDRSIDTYPSIYNALHIWYSHGSQNYIATASDCSEFQQWIHTIYRLNGNLIERANLIRKINGSFDVLILYEPIDMKIFAIAKLMGITFNYDILVHHSLEIPDSLKEALGKSRNFIGSIISSAKVAVSWSLLNIAFSETGKVLIQDEQRYKLLTSRFPKLAQKEHFCVANSFIPAIEPVSHGLPWFDAIRMRWEHIVLYTGAIERWTLPLNLFDQIKNNPKVAFVFSGWSRDGYARDVTNYCSETDNIFFSIGGKSRADLNYMVSHCSIGLAFYNPMDENVRVMGLSSGKFHKYLSYDKPIIINDLPGLNDHVRTMKLGMVSDHVNINESIAFILNDYKSFQSTIRHNYSKFPSYETEYTSLIGSLYPSNF